MCTLAERLVASGRLHKGHCGSREKDRLQEQRVRESHTLSRIDRELESERSRG